MSTSDRDWQILEALEVSRTSGSLKSPARMNAASGDSKDFMYLIRSMRKFRRGLISANPCWRRRLSC